MFTASELLEKINSHITDLQFTRTPKGLYAPVEYVVYGWKANSPGINVDGL